MASKKTEAELLQEAERQAEAALAHMPEPAPEYAGGDTESDEQALGAEVQAEDRRSDATDRDRLLRLEKMMESLVANLPQSQAAPLIVPAAPDDVPRKRKEWTRDELAELLTITIFPESDPNQNRPVDVAINGQSYAIPRGVPTRVPRAVALVLEQAVVDSWEFPIENGRYVAQKSDLTTLTTTLPVHRRTPRFNFAYS